MSRGRSHVKGKKHRRKVMAQTGPSLPSQTSDAYFWAEQAANAELLLLYLRCAKRLARAHGQEHVLSDLHSVPK
eukprot:7794510-Lingulodinium_polyedra.AAC.1